MSDVSNLKDTIVAKSSQLNADDLLSGARTITVTAVKRSNSPDQPVDIFFTGDEGKPYKPCKSMRKVLVFAWGDDGREWVGRSMTLFHDHSVMWGGVKVGGIRISHLSDIERDIAISLTATKGKKAPVTIKKLTAQKQQPKQEDPAPQFSKEEITACKRFLMEEAKRGTDALKAAWTDTTAELRAAIAPDGKCPEALKKAAAEADAASAAGDNDEY